LGLKFRAQTSLLGLLIGLACLAILLRQVDLKQSWNALGGLRGPFMLVPLAVFFVNLPLRAWRWHLIFPAEDRPSFVSCLTVLGIGNMANFLLPGRAGDLARCALVGKRGTLAESSRTLATLAVEKVLDGLALLGMILFSIWALHPPPWVLQLVRIATLIFGTALVLLVVLRYRAEALVVLIRRISRWLHLSSLEQKFDSLLTSFIDGLSAITSADRMALLLLMTAAIWITEASLIWGLAKALLLPATLKSAVIASAVLGLGLMIPAAPGGLGTYELFGTEAFKLVGMAATSALALTVVIHAWVYIVNVAAGTALLTWKGISIAQLKNRMNAESMLESQGTGSINRPSA